MFFKIDLPAYPFIVGKTIKLDLKPHPPCQRLTVDAAWLLQSFRVIYGQDAGALIINQSRASIWHKVFIQCYTRCRFKTVIDHNAQEVIKAGRIPC